MRKIFWIVIAAGFLIAACKKAEPPKAPEPVKTEGEKSMILTSAVFADGAAIPKKFTCDGQDKSPPLAWSGVPAGTKSLALICDDPDAPAGTWTHWVMWNLPPSAPSLPEGVPADSLLPGGICQGQNSWPKLGYGGPCPPPGKPHRYVFKLYALDTELTLPKSTNQRALEQAMQGHIIAQTQLIGTYGR